MRELVIISGKGGTGKTSLAASFAALAASAVVADCDVDAADLHLILDPHVLSTSDFISGHEAVISGDGCRGCGECIKRCRFDAVRMNRSTRCFEVDPIACEGVVCAFISALPGQLTFLTVIAESGTFRRPALVPWCMPDLELRRRTRGSW